MISLKNTSFVLPGLANVPGIMRHENLTSNDLRNNPGKELYKWKQLCPCSTPFEYKMPTLSIVDSPALPDLAVVHWMQVAVGLVQISHILFINWLILFIILVQLMSRLLIIFYIIWLGLAIFYYYWQLDFC
jgi:hypothetical protein